MWAWLERRRDRGRGWGRCEAFFGYGFGLPVFCGRWTKLFSGSCWYCEDHPPERAIKGPVNWGPIHKGQKEPAA